MNDLGLKEEHAHVEHARKIHAAKAKEHCDEMFHKFFGF
jgi:hypothetical protein